MFNAITIPCFRHSAIAQGI